MTEQEYIKYLRKNHHFSKAEIKADIEDCQKSAKKYGISIEKMFDLRAPIITLKQTGHKAYDNDGNYLKMPDKK